MSDTLPDPTDNFTYNPNYPGILACDQDLSNNPNYPGVLPCTLNFNNDGNDTNDNKLVEQQYEDMINSYGINIDYYVNRYDKENSADNHTGTDLTQKYSYPVTLKMFVDYKAGAVSLIKFGYVSSDEIDAIITIKSFTQAMSGMDAYTEFGQPISPKAGDIIKLSNFGKSRPLGMDGKMFILTEKLDESPEINQLGGHYIWKLKFTRYQYDYRGVEDSPDGTENVLAEKKNSQCSEDSLFGRLLSGENFPTSNGTTTPNDKEYPYDREEESELRYPWLSGRNNETNNYGF